MAYTLANVIEPFDSKRVEEVVEFDGLRASATSSLSLIGHLTNLQITFGVDAFGFDVNGAPAPALEARKVFDALVACKICIPHGLEFTWRNGVFHEMLVNGIQKVIVEKFDAEFGIGASHQIKNLFVNLKIAAVLEMTRHGRDLWSFFDMYKTAIDSITPSPTTLNEGQREAALQALAYGYAVRRDGKCP